MVFRDLSVLLCLGFVFVLVAGWLVGGFDIGFEWVVRAWR